MMAGPSGCDENVANTTTKSSTPGDSTAAAQMNNVDTTSSAGDVTRDNIDDSEPSASELHGTSTTLITAENDIAPTRDTSAVNLTQLLAYSSGNLFSG